MTTEFPVPLAPSYRPLLPHPTQLSGTTQPAMRVEKQPRSEHCSGHADGSLATEWSRGKGPAGVMRGVGSGLRVACEWIGRTTDALASWLGAPCDGLSSDATLTNQLVLSLTRFLQRCAMTSTLNCQLRIDIQPRYAFDCRTECDANLHFLSSNAIVFPVGRHLAVQRLDLLSAAGGEGGARASVSGSAGGQHLQQSMGFLVRPLGHPPPHEEGGAGGAHVAASPAPFASQDSSTRHPSSASQEHKDDGGPTAPPKPTRHHHTDSTAAYGYMLSMHWNTQTLSRLRFPERDWLSRHESLLLSCFSVQPHRKLLLTCEHSTNLRLVVVSVVDIHAAAEEDFTQLSVRRFRTNFLVLPCVQALTSDKGRREARERRLRHEGRQKNLRRVARLKAQRARLEEQRLQELKESVGLAAMDVTSGSGMGSRSRSRNPSRPSSPPLPRDTISSLASSSASVSRSLAEELRTVKAELQAAEKIVSDMGPRSDGEEDSEIEGYESEEMKSEDSSDEDAETEADESFAQRTAAGSSTLGSPTASSAAASHAAASSPRVSFAPDTAAAVASPARPTPHHRISTESWSNHIRDVKAVDTLGDRGVAASWRAQADAIARAALEGMPLPAIPDPGKEELLFSRLTHAEFSADGKFVAMVGDGPRFPLMVWETFTTSLLGSNRFVNAPVSKVAFKPGAPVLTAVTLGPAHLRIWEVKTKQSEHAHSFLSPIALGKEGASATEQFVDFAFLASNQPHQSLVVLTTERVVILQDDQIVTSTLLVPSWPASVPRALAATSKGYALAFDGFVDLFEFRRSSTIFVPVEELRDEDGRDFQAAKAERLEARREEQRLAEKEERNKSNRVLQARHHAPNSPGAGVYQSSLFERLHHLGPADSASSSAVAKSPTSGKVPATSAERRAEAAAAADLQRRRDELEVFHAKSVPLFRPVPGCAPPPPSGVAAAMAAQCNAPVASASRPATAVAPGNVPQGAHLFLVHSMACSPDEHSLLLTSTTCEIIHIPIDGLSDKGHAEAIAGKECGVCIHPLFRFLVSLHFLSVLDYFQTLKCVNRAKNPCVSARSPLACTTAQSTIWPSVPRRPSLSAAARQTRLCECTTISIDSANWSSSLSFRHSGQKTAARQSSSIAGMVRPRAECSLHRVLRCALVKRVLSSSWSRDRCGLPSQPAHSARAPHRAGRARRVLPACRLPLQVLSWRLVAGRRIRQDDLRVRCFDDREDRGEVRGTRRRHHGSLLERR